MVGLGIAGASAGGLMICVPVTFGHAWSLIFAIHLVLVILFFAPFPPHSPLTGSVSIWVGKYLH